MENGITKLLSVEPNGSYSFLLADDATFAKWARVVHAPLWKLVWLHSHLDPDLNDWFVLRHYLASHAHLQGYRDGPPRQGDPVELIRQNIDAAVTAVEEGGLRPIEGGAAEDIGMSLIKMTDFLEWSLRSHLPVVQGFRSRNASQWGRFPWGAYTTPKIEALVAVAGLWRLESDGGSYDPSRTSTAPSTRAIRQALEKHRLAGTAAESIVSIARDPRLRPGPRGGKATESS